MSGQKKRRPGGRIPGRQTNKGKITPSSSCRKKKCTTRLRRFQERSNEDALAAEYAYRFERDCIPHRVKEDSDIYLPMIADIRVMVGADEP